MFTKTVIAGQLLAFWPVWRWYIERMTDGSDEPWGILALLTVLILVILQGRFSVLNKRALQLSLLMVLLYIGVMAIVPPLINGILAVSALGFVLSSTGFRRIIHPAIFALLLLSLPLIASMQFYGGFPLRWLTAHISAAIVSLLGYPATAQGTVLHWFGERVVVDAPCAGIKMLWAGLYLNFTLAAWKNLGFAATWLASTLTMSLVFAGNVLRATLLFFTESGIVKAPGEAHQAIGLAVFVVIMLGILKFHHWFAGNRLPNISGNAAKHKTYRLSCFYKY